MNDAKAVSKPLDGEMKSTGPIVHMRADSDSLLESMFQFALKPAGSEMPANYKPYRMRKLPDSFFKPPQMGTKSPSCHSRENSHDSTSLHDPYSPASMNVGSPQTATQPQPQRPPPSHSVSSVQQPHHSRAHSSPATLQPANLVPINIPQSPQHPAQPQQQPQPQMQPQQPQQPQQIQHHYRQASLDVNLGQHEDILPTEWDRAIDEKGQVFYRNHKKKTTQWEHPLPPLLQNLGPLPPRWVLSTTLEDEIYYIDHSTESTSWYDPRLPQGQQPQVPHRVVNSANPTGGTQRPLSGVPQNTRRQLLDDQLRRNLQKQQELQRMQAQHSLRLQRSDVNVAHAQEMLLRSSLNEPQGGDPFLTSSQNNEIHNRQESADSGLGMGSNFNLGSIPEDISGIESMDTGDLDTTLTGDINPTVSQSSANPTSADHLLTSLPDGLGEDISSDLMESFLDSNQTSADPNPNKTYWL